MSGMRWTSLQGNIWNCVITTLNLALVTMCLGRVPKQLYIAIRGDDSSVQSDPASAGLFRIGYAVLGAIGHDLKFALMPGGTEFLRETYSSQGVRGLVNRAIPSISQKRPWSDETTSPISMFKIVSDQVLTMKRRASANFTSSFAALECVTDTAARVSHNAASLISTPLVYGGASIGLPPQHSIQRVYMFNNVVDVPPKVVLTSDWKTRELYELLTAEDLPVELIQIDAYVTSQVAESVSKDRIHRDKKHVQTRVNIDYIPGVRLAKGDQYNISKKLMPYISLPFDDFYKKSGKAMSNWTDPMPAWNTYSLWGEITGESAWKKYTERHPYMIPKMKKLQSRGFKRKVAIDLMSGSTPWVSRVNVRPQYQPIISKVAFAVALEYTSFTSQAMNLCAVQFAQDYLSTVLTINKYAWLALLNQV